jgi:hypothetical protein
MDDLDKKLKEILGDFYYPKIEGYIIKNFISICSLKQFEELKELDWELSQKTD